MRRAVAAALLTSALAGCPGGEGSGDPEAFCRHVERLAEQVAEAATGPEELADVPAARSLAEDVAATADALRRDAPEEIADDAGTLARLTSDLARELGDFYQAIADDPSRADDPAFLSSFEPLTPERREALEEAGKRVRPWVEEHCDGDGADLGSRDR